MNTQQRKFLTDGIEKTRQQAVNAIKDAIPDAPSLSNYLWKEAMMGTLQIQPAEHIKGAMKEMAMKAKQGSMGDWLQENRWGGSGEKTVAIKIVDLLVLPPEYVEAHKAYETAQREAYEKMNLINSQADTLITRITLASDKILQQLMNEVDDMGSIGLMDTKLKQLTQTT